MKKDTKLMDYKNCSTVSSLVWINSCAISISAVEACKAAKER